jgi:tetratricopeptide (TPR) repeat protein
MKPKEAIVRELLGDGHQGLLRLLLERVEIIAAGDPDTPRIVILEGASGTGKTRLARELYRTLRATRDHEGYWPELAESGRSDEPARDPLPGRKCTGPSSREFTWPAGVLPGFGWWQFNCERMQGGSALDIVSQARPEIEAHLVPMTLAWNKHSSVRQKAAAKKSDIAAATRVALQEGGLEAASQVMASFDLAIPGLGAAASWMVKGAQAAQRRRELRQDTMRAVELGDRVSGWRSALADELASLIRGVTHAALPSVVVVEDAHLMEDTLTEFLDLLGTPDSAHPILIVAMAWPETRDDSVYAQWRRRTLERGHLEIMQMPYLGEEDLRRIVVEYAPNTSPMVAEKAARQYPNPLALEATLSSRVVANAIARNAGALPLEALESRPVSLDGIYRDRFRELSDEVQEALALVAGSVPYANQSNLWPFMRDIIADAVQRCSAVTTDARELLAAIEYASEGAVWLVPSGVAQMFREALQSRIAYEYLEQEVLLPAGRRDLREAIINVLSEQIDVARGDGLLLEATDELSIISNWLLGWPEWTHSETLLAAAFRVASDLAAAYQYANAIDLLEPLLDSHLTAHQDSLKIRSALSVWMGEAGRTEDAIMTAQLLLADQERLLGADSPANLATRVNLALFISEIGRTPEAITLLEETIAEMQRASEADASTMLLARNLRSILLSEVGRIDEALETYAELIEDYTRILGPNDDDTLAARGNYASCLGRSGRVDDAIATLQRLLVDVTEALGADHRSTLITRNNLAIWVSESGHVEDAVAMLVDLLSDSARVLGPDHLQTLERRSLLAATKFQLDLVDEAISELEQIVLDYMRVVGPSHPDYFSARRSLAASLVEAGRFPQGIAAFDALVADSRTTLGPDHEQTLSARHGLADALGAAGRAGDAVLLYQDLLEDVKRIYGPEHPGVLTSRANLAHWTIEAGHLDIAISQLRDLLSDSDAIGKGDRSVECALRSELARSLHAAGNIEEAIEEQLRLVAERRRLAGATSQLEIAHRNQLAMYFGEAGRASDARKELRRLLSDCEKTLGRDHPDTSTVRDNLAFWYAEERRQRRS